VDINKKENTQIRQLFLSLLPAQILIVFMRDLGQIINGIIVGNALPSEAIAAVSFVGPLNTILSSLGIVISSGVYVLCGEYIGKAKYDELDKTFTTATKAIVICGIAFTALIELFSPGIASLLGARGEALEQTMMYLRGFAVGIIPMIMNPTLVAFLNMGGQSKYVTISTIIYAAVNLIVGMLNISVLHGGVFGMGIAMSLASFSVMLFFAGVIGKNPTVGHLKKDRVDWSLFKEAFRLGSGGAIRYVFIAIRAFFINLACMTFVGTDAVSATGIMVNAITPLESISIGISTVSVMLSSLVAGEDDGDGLKRLFKFAVETGVLCDTIIGAIQFIFARQMAIMFGAKGAVVELTVIAIRMYSIVKPFQSFFSYILCSFYASLKRVNLAIIINIVGALVFPIAATMAFGALFGAYGIWSCYFVAEVLSIVVVFFISWKQLGHAPRNLGDWLWLDDAFTIPAERKLSLSVSTMDEVVSVGQQVQTLCNNNDVNRKSSYLSGLCLEEMAANIIKHGFTKGKPGKKYTVDIFVMIEDDKVSMRLRDNAPAFDPNEKIKLSTPDPEHPEKNMGIRLVQKISDRMYYTSNFSMNVLHIDIAR